MTSTTIPLLPYLADGSNPLGVLDFKDASELTIAAGVVTRTQSTHRIDTEADAATDDLVTINGGSQGNFLILYRENAARAVVLKHATGNLVSGTGGDVTIPVSGFVVLYHDGTNWRILSAAGTGEANTASNQGAGGVGIFDAKVGVDLQFRNVNVTANGGVSATLDAANKEIDLALAINGMTAETTLADDDEIAIYDASAAAHRKVTRGNLVAATPVAAPRGYIDGLVLSNSTDADHDIQIGAGVARDTGNTRALVLSSPLIKQIDAAWAAGNNAGGFPSGIVLAANTWYRFFVIRKTADGSLDAGFDTSTTATQLLADAVGYSEFRQVGWVKTDASSNILAFEQFGDEFLWDDPPLDVDVTNPGTTQVDRGLSVPTGDQVIAVYNAYLIAGAARTLAYLHSGGQNDEAPSSTAGPLATLAAEANAHAAAQGRTQITFTSGGQGGIRTRLSVSDGSTVLRIATLGWIDRRGRSA